MEKSRRDFLKTTGVAAAGAGVLMSGVSGAAEASTGRLDMKVVNGTLFIPGVGLVKSGVGIQGGKVVMIAPDDRLPAAKETIDAKGLFVIPGICDMHWHLGIFAPYRKEMEFETRWALTGGVTTIGSYMGEAKSYLNVMPGWIKDGNELASTDFMLMASLFHKEHIDEIPACYNQFRMTGFKFFMNDSGIPDKGFFHAVSDDVIRYGLRIISSLEGAIACGHCEDVEMVRRGRAEFAKKTNPTLQDWGISSPPGAEADASRRFVNMCRETGARGKLVHTSSRESVEILTEMFKEGRDNIYVETTPAYLGLNWNDEHPKGSRVLKMLPPIRGNDAQEALWKAVRNGVANVIGCDNVPNTLADKGTDMKNSNPGFPVAATMLPVSITEGFYKRGVPWTTIVERMTKAPAEMFGIYPRKGTIAVGSDADLVIFDLNKEKVIDPTKSVSYSDYSLFDGRRVKGWAVQVIKGGQLVVDNDKVLSKPGNGKYITSDLWKKKG